jgi:hypothetical protein
MNIARIRNGAILLSAGVILLLNTTEYLAWSVWLKIFSLWPVALIAIGIELLFKKSRLAFIALLSPLLFFATILGPALFFGPDFGEIHRGNGTYHLSRDFDSTFTGINASIRMNAGNLNVSSGGKLISAELEYCSKKPLLVSKQDGQNQPATFEITDKDRTWFSGRLGKRWFGRSSRRKDWDVKLTDQIPLTMKLYLKAGEAELDFSDLKLQECDLDVRDSDTDIKVGEMLDEIALGIRSRSSKVSLSIPEGTGLRIVNHTNLSSTSFSWFTLEEKDDGYQTPGYDEAGRKLTLNLEGSLTRLTIRKYEPFEGI